MRIFGESHGSPISFILVVFDHGSTLTHVAEHVSHPSRQRLISLRSDTDQFVALTTASGIPSTGHPPNAAVGGACCGLPTSRSWENNTSTLAGCIVACTVFTARDLFEQVLGLNYLGEDSYLLTLTVAAGVAEAAFGEFRGSVKDRLRG